MDGLIALGYSNVTHLFAVDPDSEVERAYFASKPGIEEGRRDYVLFCDLGNSWCNVEKLFENMSEDSFPEELKKYLSSKYDFSIYKNKIPNNCPLCRKHVTLGLSPEEFSKYNEYLLSCKSIQDVLLELSVCEREFLISGCCPKCQEYLFGRDFYGNKNRWTLDGQNLTDIF